MRLERPARRPSRRSRRREGIAASVILAGALVLLVSLGPAASASSYGPTDPPSWTNGLVLCQFASTTPAVGVSALSMNGTGLSMGALGVSELRPDQSVAAVASLAGAVWNVTNRSTEDAYDLAYSIHSPLEGAGSSSAPIGSADLSVDFVLPAYQGSPDGPTDTVRIIVSVTNWTWQGAGDHLAMTFGAWPSFPSGEHLSVSEAPGWVLAGSSNSSGSELQRLGMNASASATAGSAEPAPVSANGSLTLVSPEDASLSVSFGTSAGAFTALTFTLQVAVVLPSTVAGVPIGELAAAGAAATVLSLAIAGVSRRLRRRPSRLIYVTEEEKP